jgi:hypothetical protein
VAREGAQARAVEGKGDYPKSNEKRQLSEALTPMKLNLNTLSTSWNSLLAGSFLVLGAWSGKAQISLGVCPGTNAPVTTAEDTPLTFTLQRPPEASCVGTPGPVRLVSIYALNGTVTTTDVFANPPTVTYTPNPNFSGTDIVYWNLDQSNCCNIQVYAPVIVTPLGGPGQLTPEFATVRVGDRLDCSLTWTHPAGWLALNTIDLVIADDAGSVLSVRWNQAQNTFSLFNPGNGNFSQPAPAGSNQRLQASGATVYVQQCGSLGSGPTGPSVVLYFSLSFKPQAAGRTFQVNVLVTDDFGAEQGWEDVGALTVTKK